ncbi:MAG: PKD domain-containing protein, partial [Bacteroidota bacterium]|nr:PKD domain-containing protein [Bacteroidota bacterium]
TKTVQLTVSNGMCSEIISQNITIEETPVADFTHISTYCTTDSVNFENTGTLGTTGATYEWSFGSGATPANTTDENPVGIIYDSPGIKTVELITTLGSCTDTMVKTINITETPDPDFIHTAPQCEEALVDFSYTGTTGIDWNYLWDFGEGATPATSTQQNPGGVFYNGAGTKTVQLTVSNGMCSETVTHNFDINEKPIADFTHISTYCTTDSVNFENTGTLGTTGATYEWSFGSGATPANTTDENPVGIMYDSPGIKTVQLITTLGSCTDTMVKTINITETPDPDFTHNAPQCAGTSINFSYTGTTGNDWNYMWDFGQGANPAISTQQNPESVKYSGGDKSVLLTVTNAQCSESIEQTISIHPLPVADAGVDTTICANTSVQIGSDPVSGYDYQWWDPDNSLDDTSIANPTASPTASVTTYHLLVIDSNGCQNRDSVTVVMMNSAFVDAGSDVEICYGDTVQIGMGLIEWQSYEWTPEHGLSDPNIPNPIASPDSTTIYTVSVQYEQCDTITDDVKVLVHPLPDIEAAGPNGEDTVEIAQGNNTQLIATGGTQYEWDPVFSLNSAGIYNPIAYPETSTLYTVTGTDIYGCVNDDDVYVLVRIPGLYIPSAFTPNGDDRNDVFYVRSKGTKDFELNIVSRSGDLLYHSSNPYEGWDGTVQGTSEEVPSGAYVYHTKGEFSDGEKFNESGIINLIR